MNGQRPFSSDTTHVGAEQDGTPILPEDYYPFLHGIKTMIRDAQMDTIREVNRNMPSGIDFLTMLPGVYELRMKRRLMKHLEAYLLEMSAGFAFVGSQYHLEVSGKDYYLDLLFYHLRLRCFVIVDLKMGAFQPEFAGKMNFYLSAVDDLLKHPSDAPTIGLILCKERDGVTVEYALRNTSAPIGVAEFIASLPAELQASLPTVQQIEAELAASDTSS